MPGLEYVRADNVDSAVALVTADPGAAYLAASPAATARSESER